MPNEKVIVEYRGIRDLVAAPLIKDTLNELTYGTPFSIAGIAELSKTTENSSESHYYDNIAAIVINTVGADEVTCTCSAIPLEVLAKLTGQYYNSVTNTLVEGNATAKYFAIGYVTEDTDGNEVYVWRHKVKCSIPDSTHSTKNDSADANGQEIVFTGIDTIHKFSTTGKSARAINHKASGFIPESDFFATVMDIDKLVTIANAVTSISVTPTTASVAVGSTTTITSDVTIASGASPASVIWTSSDDSVATVSAGVVTGISAGTAIITASAGDESATCTVTVTE